MNEPTYPGYGAELDAGKIRKLLDKEPWEEASYDDDMQERRLFLGTVFGLTPSGKYYVPFACSNVAGCPSCKGTGEIYNVKRRVEKKRTSRYAHDRRHYMQPRRQVVYVHRERRDAAHKRHMRTYQVYASSTRSCTACGSMGSREAYLDTKWHDYAERLCESIGATLENGEGDACDLFVVEYRDKPEEEEYRCSRCSAPSPDGQLHCTSCAEQMFASWRNT